MKISKKFLAIMVAVILLTTMVTPALAATADASAEAGENVIVYFTYDGIYGIDGNFSVNDPSKIISSIDYRIVDDGGMGLCQIVGDRVYGHDTQNSKEPFTVQFGVVIKLKSDAEVGETCTINFEYNLSKEPTGQKITPGTEAATIKVKASESSDPVDPTQPTEPADTVDYSELERQIAIATGLNESDYTADSWKAMADALAAAKNALNSEDQKVVDNAAKALSDAINALTRMDYSKLQAELDKAIAVTEDKAFNDLLQNLLNAIEAANKAMLSNDQAAVDAATEALLQAIAEYAAALENLKKVEIQTVEKEVIVEVYPEDPFCNISWHKIMQILLIVSAILNVVFIVIFILAAVKKKKNQKDNTPLVDYDIDDDV